MVNRSLSKISVILRRFNLHTAEVLSVERFVAFLVTPHVVVTPKLLWSDIVALSVYAYS